MVPERVRLVQPRRRPDRRGNLIELLIAGRQIIAQHLSPLHSASAATPLISIDVFIVSFLRRRAYWARAPARTFSFACASFGGTTVSAEVQRLPP